MRPWLRLMIAVPALVALNGCEEMWNGPNDLKPTPQQVREQQEKLERDRHFGQHVDQQSPEFRQKLRNGGVSGDY